MNIQEIAQGYKYSDLTGVTVIDGNKGERKEMFLRQLATSFGAGQTALVDGNTIKTKGVTNFADKDMLPANKKWVVLGLKMSFDSTASATVLNATYGKTAGLPAMVNGNIIIEQEGVLTELPIKAIAINNDQAGFGKNSSHYYEVLPFQIKGGSPFQIKAECVAAVGADLAFELALDVVEITESTKTASAQKLAC